MYVKSIELKNFKKVGDFSTEFNGGVYLIKGENELGKSSLINSIVSCLTGDRSDNLLTTGKDKGHAKIVVGEKEDPNGFEVELKFSEKNPRGTIKVTHLETGMESSNKSFLQKQFGYQEFDANEFVRWSETADGRRKQVAIIKSLLPEEVVAEIDNIDIEVKDLKEERKEFNTSESYVLGKIDQTVDLSILEKDPIDKEAIQKELQQAYQINERRKTANHNLELIKVELENIPVKVSEIKNAQKNYSENIANKLDQLKEEYDRNVKEAQLNYESLMSNTNSDIEKVLESEKATKERRLKTERYLVENKEVDVEEIMDQSNEATVQDQLRSVAIVQMEKKEELAGIQESIKKSNENIEKNTNRKKQLLSENKLPIDGLSFDDEWLYLNGIKVRNGDISTSQEMELAVKILMAKNKTVKVFKIGQGESLGRERFNTIMRFAKENGYQGFVEVVEMDNNQLTVEEYFEDDNTNK